MDVVTKQWIRNVSDERAAANGCKFEEKRGRHVIEFSEKYLRLYEGAEWAGRPLNMTDWQAEASMRLFGWVRWSERWKRWIRRFTNASIWVSKKNKKSPTLAAWALYLLAADGENGQKVYFGAKDGGQAREIAGKHAVEMVLASEELRAECSINKNLMQITHEPTRSILKPISSSDSRSQKAKEGLNGCILVDETHVVDREFMSRISRSGISRSEPLLIEVSTAGSDPESYGKERYDYGKRVECGDVTDEQFFFLSYEAPQELKDDELAADPVKYGKMANPAWGQTVNEQEFIEDYNRSRVSLARLAEFKMYRLNIWQQSENPWLNMGDWKKCYRSFTAESLHGRECYAGLDLAKTRDTTALVLMFPEEDGTIKQLPFFWLPENTARNNDHLVQYMQWAGAGFITLTNGKVTDYNFVRHKINEVRETFDIRVIAYDATYAEQMMQRLVEEDGMDSKMQIKFPQTALAFAGPTAAYERMVHDEKLHHNGNPLLTWQAGNVRAKPDPNENIRPVKQRHGDHRTIDGIVAGIMALNFALAQEPTDSVYDHGGCILGES